VTVLPVDDQARFLRAAASLIEATPGFEQVGQAGSGPEALELVADLQPDLVLLDVRMPGMDGIETARRLADGGSTAMVVLMSVEDLPDLALPEDAGGMTFIRKQDLSTRALRELWRTRKTAPGHHVPT
jgi:two-component system, NarL family, invasion response regulator UvrY